tara:strand:+ start:8239 stop:10197 length:1959 start_codon:yes stop_codon:yes gene_type:complete
MANTRTVKKSKGGVQDLLLGKGTQNQDRAGGAYIIDKLDIPVTTDTVAEMQALDVEDFTRARVYSAEDEYIDYVYKPADLTGISSDTGNGTWHKFTVGTEGTEAELTTGTEVKQRWWSPTTLARWVVQFFARNVGTVVALRNLEPLIDGQQVSLLGHTNPGLGGGVFYYDASDTTSVDNNGTILVTTGSKRWKRTLNGYVTPEMFGLVGSGLDESLVYQTALDTANALGLELLSTRSCKLSSTIIVTSRIRHESRPTYDGSALGVSDDMFQLTGSNNGVGQVALLGRYVIDMATAGRDAIYVRKGEHVDLGAGYVLNPGRASINIEPFENFAWVENLKSDGFKCQGGVSWIRARVANYTAVFINKVSMHQFEGRTCTGIPIDVVIGGSTSAQSIAEWNWINPEFDTKTDAGNGEIVFVTVESGAVGNVNSWSFNTPTFEDLRDVSALPGGVPHPYVFGCNEPSTFFSIAVIGGTRFNYNSVADANTIDGIRIYTGSGRLDITPITGDFNNILGKTKIRRALIDTGDTFRTNAGSESTFAGKMLATDVQTLQTTVSGGDSFYSAGQTKTIFTIGSTIVIDGVGQELHSIEVLPVNAAVSSLYSEFKLFSHDVVANVKNVVVGDFSLAVVGSDVQLTNNNASGQSVRVRSLRLQ